MASRHLTGVEQMRTALGTAADDLRRRMASALYIEGNFIIGDSQENYVPVDYGTLKSSARVSAPEWEGDEVVVTLSYGGAAIAYALAVHEHLSKHSPYSWQVAKRVTFHPAGRGPKYLSKPLNKHSRGLAKRIQERVFGGRGIR